MAVILYDDFGMFFLDHGCQLAEHGRLADAGHIFQTDFFGTGFYQLVGNAAVIFSRVYRRCCDAKCCLRCHAAFFGIFDAGNDVAHIVQSTEDTCYVNALCMFDFVHQLADIGWYRIHPQGIQSAIQHVCFDTCLVERFCKSAYCLIRIFSIQQIHLLEGTTVCLDARKATHVNDGRCYTYQLIFARLEFSGRLKHVAVYKAELDSFLH